MQSTPEAHIDFGPPLRLQIDDDDGFLLRRSNESLPDAISYHVVDDTVAGKRFPWIGIVQAIPNTELGPPHRLYCVSESARYGIIVTANMAYEQADAQPVRLGRMAAGRLEVPPPLLPYRVRSLGNFSYQALVAVHRNRMPRHTGTERMTRQRLRTIFGVLLANTPFADDGARLV